ncbi:MAG: restriction endonuclease subunit S [Caldilineaceae bacterium]|nr:restriction endonuclease subunit S [Caldilineaceae bacterium]
MTSYSELITDNELPEDWKLVSLGDMADYINGAAFKPSDWSDTGLPIIRIQNLTGTSQNYNYFPGKLSDRYKVSDGDLLISWSASLGAFIWQGGNAWLNQHIFKVANVAKTVDKLLLYFALRHHIDLLTSQTRGSTMKHIVRNAFLATQIPLPPLAEQRRIAAVLNTIQEAIAAQEDVIAAAKAFKRSLMHRLFTYGPGAEPAPTKETEIGEIPAHWEIKELDSLLHVKLGKMLSKASKLGVAPKPYVRNANVQWGYIDISDIAEMDFLPDERDKFRLRSGDILVCEGGEIGRTAIWEDQLEECYYQKAIHRLRPKTNGSIDEKYFLYYMTLLFVVRKVSIVEGARSTIAHLPVDKLKMLPIAYPAYKEQVSMAEQLSAADAKVAAEEDRKAALEALFKSMLHQLMTGQIRLLSDEGLPLPQP